MSEHQQENQNGGHFSSGFFLGLLIGGGAALLIATKRGREILRDVSESGLTALDKMDESADPLEEVYDEEMDDAGVPMAPTDVIEPGEDEIPHSRVRRFFKKPKKK